MCCAARQAFEERFNYERVFAPVIGLPPRRIRVIKPRIGGGFGVKQEVLLEDICALLTIATDRRRFAAWSLAPAPAPLIQGLWG